MSIQRCHDCDKDIDTDFDAEHFSEEEYTVADATRDINDKINEAYVRGMADAKEKIVEIIEKKDGKSYLNASSKMELWEGYGYAKCREDIISKIKEL